MASKQSNTVQLIREGFQHHQAGRLQQAEQNYRQVIAQDENNAEAHHLLGIIACQAGNYETGVRFIRKALQVNPEHSGAHKSLGKAQKDLGLLEEAAASFRIALELNPNYAEAYNELGVVLHELKCLPEAAANFQHAIVHRPEFAEAHYNLGNMYMDLGQLSKAAAAFRQAISINPDYPAAHNNLGNSLRLLGKLDEARSSFQKAIIINLNYAEAHNNLGNLYNDQFKYSPAAVCFQRAIVLKPDFASAHSNLGNVFFQQGKIVDAIACFKRAAQLGKTDAYSNLLFALNYDFDTTQEEIYTKSLDWGSALLQNLGEDVHAFPNNLDKSRRLRIGYLSPDFRTHSVAYFFEPVLKAHDRGTVEIFCYANVKKQDETTLRLQAESDHWRLIAWKSDAEVVAQIRKDSIDILVDLAGHTGENRLPVFARRPAPVQVSWLGYPNTTGLRTIDYRLTDAVADPAGDADRVHSEKLIRLEHGFLCYQPDASTPGVTGLPSLTQGHITFGSFNNLAKVRPEVIKAWAAILHAVPGSHLLLKAKQLRDNEIRDRYLNMFTAEGIAADRIELLGMLPRKEDHLNLYNRIDIGLDPFPYNGTTTTCEALWMGVPVVTIQGDRHGGRVGASVLHRVGLEELVAVSAEEYIRIACTLAADRQQLQALRVGLRQQLQESELMDSESFTRHLEDIYRQVWRKWIQKST